MPPTPPGFYGSDVAKLKERIRARFPDAAEVVTRLLVCDGKKSYAVKVGPWEKRFPGGLPWRQARLVSWCRDTQGEIFRVRTSHALSITDHCTLQWKGEWTYLLPGLGPRFEGSGYLGWIILSRTFRIGASNRLEVVRAPGNGENMEAWPEVVVETLGRQ